ncbi:MAG: hypothetical protein R3A79_01690 [Nannocystaceae bacterium]
MPRPTSIALALLAPLLGLDLACVGDDASTSAATATATSTTDSTSTTAASTSASTGDATTSAGTGDASTSDGASSTTVASTSTASTAATTGGETDTDTSAGTTTTGGGEVCEDLSGVDFGACATPLGWAFDGEACVLISGCGCDEGCDAIFADAAACAATCAAAGECRDELFQGAGIFEGPFGVGDFCDEIDVCGESSGALPELLGATCDDRGGYPCDGASRCAVDSPRAVTPAQYADLCAASLLPDVSLIACVVWGP